MRTDTSSTLRPSRLVAGLGVLAVAGAATSVVILVNLAASVLADSPASWHPVDHVELRAPILVAVVGWSAALLWAGLARTGLRVPGGEPVHLAAVVPWCGYACAVTAAVAVWPPFAWTLVVRLIVAWPTWVLIRRFFLQSLDAAAFASSRSAREADVAEAKVALASLALGGAPLALIWLAGPRLPVAMDRGAGLFLASLAAVVPALGSLAALLVRRAWREPRMDDDAEARRAWSLDRTLGLDLGRLARRSRLSEALLVAPMATILGGAAWGALPTGPAVRLALVAASLGVGWVLGSWSRRALVPPVAVAVGGAVVLGSLDRIGFRGGPMALGLGLLALCRGADSMFGPSGASLDDVDRRNVEGSGLIVVLAGVAACLAAVFGERAFALGSAAGACLAVCAGIDARLRASARALLAERALAGRAPGVEAHVEGPWIVVSMPGPDAYRDGAPRLAYRVPAQVRAQLA